MAVVVVYGGGFQPFHAGHLSSYVEAKRAFPDAEFFVAASNDVKQRPIPFKVKKFLAQQAGVRDAFVEVRQPLNPKEILEIFDPAKDIFVLVRSERDPMPYTKKDGSPAYFQPFVSLDQCNPYGKNAYVLVTKKKDFTVNGQEVYSGSQVRDMYTNADDVNKEQIISQLYPKSSHKDTIKQVLDQYLQSTPKTVLEPKVPAAKQLKNKKLAEMIKQARPLLKEASIEKKVKFLKLLKDYAITNIEEAVSPTYGDVIKTRNKIAQQTNPTRNKFIWKRPNQIRGSYTDQQLISQGFRKSAQNNLWGGTQEMWDRLSESLNEFAPPSSDDGGGDNRSRRIRKLLEIAIQVAKEKNVDELGMIHAMNMIAGDEFFNTAVEGILPDITDKEYMFVLQSAYKTVKQGLAEAKKKRKKKSKNRSLGRYFFPGYSYYGGSGESGEDGGDAGGEGVAEGSDQITEYRNRLLQYVKSLLPTWPEYVLKDWLVPNKGDFSNLPPDALKNSVMEKVKGAGLTPNSKWQLVPDMKFTMDMFDPMTKQRLIGRAGGSSDMGLGVPKDKERHATQAALAQQQGGVRKEPVLLIKTAKGYELLEGWHRTIQHFHKFPDGYTGPAYVAVAQGQQGVAEGYSNTTFNVDRRKLNIPTLIQKGAILVTHPHGEQGWETDNKEDWAFSLLSLYNVLQGGWASEAKKYLKPESYKRAEQQINSSAPNLGSDKLVYDGKYNQILWSIKKLGIPDNVAFLDKDKQGVAEGVPQPGPSSGAPKQFGADAKIQTRQMTVKDIISSIPGVPYYNNVVDDWDAKDYSWGVTKKVIEYATYLKDHPESLAKLPPAIVLNGKFEDGAHRVSAIWLLQQRMDPKNPLWKNAKLNVQFVKQGVAEGSLNELAPGGNGGDGDDDKYIPPDFGKPFKANYLGQNKFQVFCRRPQDPSNVITLIAEVQKYGLEWEDNFGFWFLDSPGAVYLSWKYGEIPLPKAIDQARNPGHIHDLVTDYLTNSPHASEIQQIATEYFGFTMDGDMNESVDYLDEK